MGLMVFVLAVVMLMPVVGMAEAATAAPTADTGAAVVEVPDIEVGEPLDKVWKIPTRVFAYVVALGVMLVATAFTTGLTVDNALLVGVNALLAALSAYGAYEVTFGKIEKN